MAKIKGKKVIKDAKAENFDGVVAIYGSSTGYGRYADVEIDTGVRQGFDRNDYEGFRQEEAIPTDPKAVMCKCMDVTKRIGLVANIINLMSDFTIQGITIKHPQKSVEKFYKEWWDKVNGYTTSEKFVRILYKVGVAAVQRDMAKLNVSTLNSFKQGLIKGAKDENITPEKLEVKNNTVPWLYTFLNPVNLEVLGGELAVFANDYRYGVRIPESIITKVKQAKNKLDSTDKDIIANLPSNVTSAIKNGKKVVPLDPDKTEVFYYKKDDWEQWPCPILQPILPDIVHLEKARMADLSALDGAIRNIRLWKIGDLTAKIPATRAQMKNLAAALAKQTAGGSIDLIWGPAITFEESKSNLHEFLGSEKYDSCLNAIYAGLGIPPTLTGAATAAGFTNNYISLKTLLERLAYVRNLLIEFWEKEIRMVQKAIGIQKPAIIQFDRMTLADDAAEKALLVQLLDRGVLDEDTVLERFGENADLINYRQKKEEKKRETGKKGLKVGPYHSTPEEQMGVAGEGRPKNAKDGVKRKQKKVKPRVSASSIIPNIFVWAKNAQQKISDIVDPVWLTKYKKKNLRMLGDKEVEELENHKFAILCNLKPLVELEDSTITTVSNSNPCMDNIVKPLWKETKEQLYLAKQNATLDDLRHARLGIYSLIQGADYGESCD